jgi:hypothetical protein
MIKRLLILFLCSGVLAARASTITFQPTSQTIALGSSTTVNVEISGLSADQALGAFDLFVLNNSSILSATGLTYSSFLGDAGSRLTDTVFGVGSVEGAENSYLSNPDLLALQSTQPFSLFQLTYTGIGVGTSSLTLGSPLVLADGTGAKLDAPTVIAGSITVTGTTPPPVPEPSSLALLSTGCGSLLLYLKRRRAA